MLVSLVFGCECCSLQNDLKHLSYTLACLFVLLVHTGSGLEELVVRSGGLNVTSEIIPLTVVGFVEEMLFLHEINLLLIPNEVILQTRNKEHVNSRTS